MICKITKVVNKELEELIEKYGQEDGLRSFLENKILRSDDVGTKFIKFNDGKEESTMYDVLEKISKSSSNLAVLAKELLKRKIGNTKISIITVEEWKERFASDKSREVPAGFYSYDTKELYLISGSSFSRRTIEGLLLHEILHYYTVEYLNDNIGLSQSLDRVLNYATLNTEHPELYGYSNSKEFLAELFTDPDLIKDLLSLPAYDHMGEYSNLFEELWDTILRVLGITKENKTLYDQAFALGTQLLEDVYQYETAHLTADVGVDYESYDKSINPLNADTVIPIRGNEDLYKQYNLLNANGTAKALNPDSIKTKKWLETNNKSPFYSFVLRQTPKGWSIFITDKMKPTNGQMSLFQASSKEGPSIKSLDLKITGFLNRLGIQVHSVSDLQITDVNGNKLDAISVAKLLEKIILVAEGKARADTLGEEAAHFLVELLGDHPLVKAMMDEIENYEIYQEVLSEYAGIEGYEDELTLKKEAVGKLIAKVLVAKETGEKIPQRAVSWVEAVMNMIKSFFRKLSSKEVREVVSPFEIAANKILEGDISGLSFDNYSENTPIQMYELSDGQKKQRDTLLHKLSEKVLNYDQKTAAYYRSVDGRRVGRRVHDLIKEMNRKIFNRPDRLDEKALRSANAGTVLHKVLEITFNKMWIGQKPTHEDVMKLVMGELRSIPEFASKDDAFFLGIAKKHHFNNAIIKTVEGVIKQIKEVEARIAKTNGLKPEELDPKVFTEVMLYDSNQDLAGTVDLLVVHSNGAVSKFDWKSMIFDMVGGKTVKEPAWYKRANWDQQLAIYDDILNREYGVTDFALSRIIPINIQFDSKDNSIFSMQSAYTQPNNPHLKTSPTITERTGFAAVDAKIEELMDTRNKLLKKYLYEKRDRKVLDQLNRVSDTIKALQVNQDFNYVYQELMKINKYIQDREHELEYIDGPENKKKNPNYLDEGTLTDLQAYIALFDDFSKVAVDHAKEIGIDPKPYESIAHQYIEAKRTIETKLVEQMVERTGLDFKKPTKQPGFLTRWFSPLSHFEHPVLKALSKIVVGNFEYTRQRITQLAKDLDTKSNILKEWAKLHGMSELQAYKKLYNPETGNLYVRHTKKFSEDLKEAQENKKISWIIKNTEVEAIDMDGEVTYAYTGKSKERFDKARARNIESLHKQYDSVQGGEKKIKELTTWWDKQYNVSKSTDALLNAENEFIELKESSTEYDSAEWKYIQDNKPLKEYYDYYISVIKELNELLEERVNSNFVANINQSMIDKILQSGISGLGDMGSTFLQSMQLQQDDKYRGAISNSDGEKTIPLLYRHEQRDSLDKRETQEVADKIKSIKDKDGNLMFIEGTPEYEEELIYEIKNAEYAKARRNKSVDLSKTLLLFADSVFMHSALSDTEGAVKALRNMLTNPKQKSLAVDTKGKTRLDTFTHKYALSLGISEGEIEVFDKFVDMYYYGIHGGQGDYTFTAFGKEWSSKKIYQQFMKYIAVKQMGLSPLPAFSNIVGGKMNIMMLGAEGLYFTTKQFRKTQKRFIARDTKVIAALNWLQPYSHDISNEKARKLSASKISTQLTVDNMFVWYRQGDNMMSSDIGLAMMENFGVDPKDNTVKPLQYIEDKTVKPLIEVAEVKEDGTFTVPGLSAAEYTKFRQSVLLVVNKAIGSMSEEDKNLAGSNLLIATIMMFKNWIPGLTRTRFESFGKNSVGIYDVGRYNVLMGEFTEKGVLPKLKAFTELLTEVMLFGANNTKANDAVALKYYKKYITDNRLLESELSLEQFKELRRKKLRGMGMELRVYLAFLLAVLGAKMMIPPDKDDPLRKPAVLAFRMVNRSLLEVSFFLDPRTINQVGGTAIPPIRLLNDLRALLSGTYNLIEHKITGEKIKKSEKTLQWGYKTVTFIPGVKAFYDVMDVYDKYQLNTNIKY